MFKFLYNGNKDKEEYSVMCKLSHDNGLALSLANPWKLMGYFF